MIYFGIPLRAKETCKDWNRVCDMFRATLKSICGQTSDDYEVIVACHDIPETDEKYKSKVTFIQADTPIPVTGREMMCDKGWKKHLIGMEIRRRGGGYVMMTDADDFVSNKIAAWCHDHPNTNGFVSKKGYVRYSDIGSLIVVRDMHKLCGSCAVVYCRPEDLPDSLPTSFSDTKADSERYIIRWPHNKVVERMAKADRPLGTLPFISTIYNRGTGENHSQMNLSGGDIKAAVKRFFKPHKRVTAEISKEFFGE